MNSFNITADHPLPGEFPATSILLLVAVYLAVHVSAHLCRADRESGLTAENTLARVEARAERAGNVQV